MCFIVTNELAYCMLKFYRTSLDFGMFKSFNLEKFFEAIVTKFDKI
jgi:hypothetical protein